jgi:hypothetical protein
MAQYGKLALRDGAIVVLALGVWWAVAHYSAGTGFVADLTGFAAGVLLAAIAFIAHEWGHWLGGMASRSRMHPARKLVGTAVFRYSRHNTLRQFLVMSAGGFIATGLAVWAVYTQLPEGLLATRVARGAVMFLTFLGVVLELPLVAIAIRKGTTPAVVGVEGPPPKAEDRAAA